MRSEEGEETWGHVWGERSRYVLDAFAPLVQHRSSGMPGRAILRYASSPVAREKCKMTEELPILKGILNGVVNYHNARRCLSLIVRRSVVFL